MYREAIFLKERISDIIIYKAPEEASNEYAGAFDLMVNSFKFD